MPTCLLTGGLGYIGSHICLELLQNNYDIIIMDNLSNSKIEKLNKIKKFNSNNNIIDFYNVDLVKFEIVNNIINNLYTLNKKIDVIIHLAGLKAVGESIKLPLNYYENNLISTLNIIKIMEVFNIKNIIFSSSATVYGSAQVPYYETSNTGNGITNPYGRSKFIQEEILKDISISNKDWNIILLRYFNPIGHINADFKEDPNGIPNNLFPYLVKVHNKELPMLNIFGSDYNTRDGTCTRDFIHVADLANAHQVCCDYIYKNKIGLKIYNVGTGKDTSVLELIEAFEKINNTKLNYKFSERRNGDLKCYYANVDLINKEIGWKAKYDINDCVKL